jgi:hypothetical protein
MNKASTDGNQVTTQSSGDNRGSEAQKDVSLNPSAAVTTEALPNSAGAMHSHLNTPSRRCRSSNAVLESAHENTL